MTLQHWRARFGHGSRIILITFALLLFIAPLLAGRPMVARPRVQAPPGPLRISQVYGGGGNSNAPFTNDFVELYNAGPDPVALGGWSVQYTSKDGASWAVTPLNGVLAPGRYFLIAQAGGDTGAPLPSPDLTDSKNMSAKDGKVALAQKTDPIAGPDDDAVVDFVGYGNTSHFEGSGAAPVLDNDHAAVRADGGCRDDNDNAGDFTRAAPQPRNSGIAGPECGLDAPTPTETPSPVPTAMPTATPLPIETPTATPLPIETTTPVSTETSTPSPTPAAPWTPVPIETAPPVPTVPPTAVPTEPPAATVTGSPTSMTTIIATVPAAATGTATQMMEGPTATDTAVATAITATATPASPTAVPADPSPETPTAVPTATPESTGAVVISEFLADPAAVDDADGEWIELVNVGDAPVNLRGWMLADLGSDAYLIETDLIVPPGTYIVLARNGDSTLNGGVVPAHLYTGFSLANAEDEIILLRPDDSVADSVAWGPGMPLSANHAGASQQRSTPGPAGVWLQSTAPWPGSAGDMGSPGSGYVPPTDAPTATPIEAATPPTVLVTATMTVTTAPAPTASPTPPPTPTSAVPVSTPTALPHLLLSEVMADPAAVDDSTGEWIEIVNADTAPANLNGWSLGDLDGDLHVITQDLFVPAAGYLVLGRSTDSAVNGGSPVAYAYTGINLANGEDEVILRAPDGSEQDRVLWSATTAGTSMERTALEPGAAWAPAWSVWHGSAGDRGSPGSGYVAAPPTPTAPLEATTTPVMESTSTPTDTVDPIGPATPTPLPPVATPLPRLLLSEVMANPAAVGDGDGEWIEIVNADTVQANLNGWILRDLGGDLHVITVDLMVAPGSYLVLGRNEATAENGGVAVAYLYTGINLANDEDELILQAPDGSERDRVEWSEAAAGVSLARRDLTTPGQWVPSATLWPGSAGDFGSPGAAYVAPPQPAPTSTPLLIPTPTSGPNQPAPGSPPDWQGPAPQIYISEVMADPAAVGDSDGEWIELFNPNETPINLRGWILTDLGSDRHPIDDDLIVSAKGYALLGRNADTSANGGVTLDYIYTGMSLANGDDEVILKAPDDSEVDRVVWNDTPAMPSGASLERASFDPARWQTASTGWPGSLGDYGSPGASAGPAAQPEPTAQADEPEEDAAPTPGDPPPDWQGPAPQLYVTEVMADPEAVGDTVGEWIEIFNPQADALDLRGWILADLGTDRHVIDDTLMVPGNGYALLGRNADPSVNGGVPLDYVYTGLSLANEEDELRLLAPDGTEVDGVAWGAVLAMPSGATLERSNFAPARWQSASTNWAGSAGDRGSPGAASGPAAPPEPDQPPDDNPEDNPNVDPAPDPNTPPDWQGPASQVYITEVMADPAAVGDTDGEWIELFNPNADSVNLQGWILADLGNDRHQIAADVVVPANGYALLGRSTDPALNGGVTLDYLYAGVTLANGEDELLLLAPDETEVDRIAWGGNQAMPGGASLERTSFEPARWQTASTSWSGSAGDHGSPGAPSGPAAPSEPEEQPPSDDKPDDPAPTPVAPPPDWQGPAPQLYVTEVMADPAAVGDTDGEWVELFNPNSAPVNLRGWILADLGSDRHAIADDLTVPAGGYVLLGRNADAASNGGVTLDYVYTGLSLANEEDELILSAPDMAEIDRITWGDDLSVPSGASLERVEFDPARWRTATAIWPDSAGDRGSPGTAAAIDTPVQPEPLPTQTPSPDATPPMTPTVATGPQTLIISEFLADPAAVADANGEWIELQNTGSAPVNLRGWILTDLGSDRHVIEADLIVPAGAYAVLGRNDKPAVNGGVAVDIVYSGLSLANGSDELLLLAPDEREVDRVEWGDAFITVTAGTSLERTGPSTWTPAVAAWPGSAGDRGTPGGPPADAAPPDATPPAPPTGTAVATITATPAPDSAFWRRSDTPSSVQIDEIAFRGSDEEFVVLHNAGSEPVAVGGWLIGDAEQPGKGEGLYELPATWEIPPDARLILARDGAAFAARYVRWPDGEFGDSAESIPTLERRTDLAGGRFALSDSGDEVILLNAELQMVDALAYRDGNLAALDLSGRLLPPTGTTIQRVPGVSFNDRADQRHRFLFAPADPLMSLTLPDGHRTPGHPIGHGLSAVWGSLGAPTTFSEDGIAPPHFLLAAAGAAGLDFIAFADDEPTAPLRSAAGVLAVRAQRWSDGEYAAIIYGTTAAPPGNAAALPGWLDTQNALAQWLAGRPPDHAHVPARAADSVAPPAGFKTLGEAWHSVPGAALPAGNSVPPLPGYMDPSPRYTGLAVTAPTEAGVLDALWARRGWLTSTPGMALTLTATNGDLYEWMGGAIAPANQVTLTIRAHDPRSAALGLALWQDNRPVRQLDRPLPPGESWQVTVPAVPGSVLFAVATRADDHFAATAPIRVAGDARGTVRISRVVPVPGQDYDGDGALTADDEFIELVNPGTIPVALSGWQLTDSRGDETESRRFTFGIDRYISGGETLRLFRPETGINLNNDGDYVRLLDPDGSEVDVIRWETTLDPGTTFSRDPQTEEWQTTVEYDPPPWPGYEPPRDTDTGPRGVAEKEALERWARGQADGPPGSIAAAKRQGLRRRVEFRAVVVVPPGFFNSSIYLADPAAAESRQSGIGVQVYLGSGEWPALSPGDWVLVRGETKSFRGEFEIFLESPGQIWPIEPGPVLAPLPVTIDEIGESLEGRLVTFSGEVVDWQGDSIYLGDPAAPDAEPVRVTVRSSLDWRRPYVNKGDRFEVTGIVSQFAREEPWNGGYRVLVRYEEDLMNIEE